VQLSDSYSGVRLEIFSDFTSLMDYVWKTPRFIEYESALEARKLEAYFPQAKAEIDPVTRSHRRIRKALEDHKLIRRFPRYIAASNLFLATSLFEHYLFALCREIEGLGDRKLADQKGNGCARFFNFLKQTDFKPQSMALYEQVDAALTLRNALLHANGDLRLSRERPKIEAIVKRKLFISADTRTLGGVMDDDGTEEVSLSPGRNAISITNHYSYRAAAYYKEFLLEISRPMAG